MSHVPAPPVVLAAIPAFRAEVEDLRTLSATLSSLSIVPSIAATSRSLETALRGSGLAVDSPLRNAGFGATVAHVAASRDDWEWLLIVNDDVSIDVRLLAPVIRSLVERPPGAKVLAYLDPVPPKRIPTLAGVLGQVSLVGPVLRRLRRASSPPAGPLDARTWFGPFSFAAVSRALWDDLGGLDPRLLFTFEDADFGRRAAEVGAEVLFGTETGVHHEASTTSRRHVDAVLPVAVWSACEYLSKWYLPRPIARAACIGALLLRLLTVPVAGLAPASHAKGILRAIAALATGQTPRLPDFENS